MIRARARYRNQILELEHPLDVADGTEVEIDVRVVAESADAERAGWTDMGMNRLEQEWNNPDDAIYDDWKKLYGVEAG